MPSWLSSASSNFLLSLQGVQQPCEDPSVDSSSKFQNSKSSLFFCAVCTLTQCPPGRVSFHRTSNSSVSCAPMHPLNAHLAELSESSVILVLLELTTEFYLCALLALARCPLGRASQNSSELLSATVFLPQPCLQGVQQP
jgi:hypothetical protein